MTPAAPAAWPAECARLLKPSISYALDVALAVTPELLSRPTPCRDWDLRMLLRHASESLAAIAEGIDTGCVGLDPAAEDGDLEGCRSGHDAGRQRTAGDLDDLAALVAGAGPGIQQLASAIAERAGGVSGQDPVLRGGVQGDASGFDALTERGQ